MVTFALILILIVAILLMAVVLMQSSKGDGLAGSIGGSSVTSVFGHRRTSDFLMKTTVALGTIFLLASLLLNIFINNTDGVDESIIQKNAGGVQQQAPPPVTTPPQQQQAPVTQPPAGEQPPVK